jgi:hypothetical protein
MPQATGVSSLRTAYLLLPEERLRAPLERLPLDFLAVERDELRPLLELERDFDAVDRDFDAVDRDFDAVDRDFDAVERDELDFDFVAVELLPPDEALAAGGAAGAGAGVAGGGLAAAARVRPPGTGTSTR